MLFNREKRIKYLGFNDRWFLLIGIIILSFITDFLFSNSFSRFPFLEAMISWTVSLFFTICNWFIIRSVIIQLRKIYPSLDDDVKRMTFLALAIVGTVLLVDVIGNLFLSYVFQKDYNPISKSRIIVPIIIISTMTMAIYEAIYYNVRLKKSIQQEEQAKQVVVQAQLDALKNQAQPHFLFNTLNTLRDIIDQNSKEDAKKFVDKLSDVYRFILESGNVNLTTLKKELKFSQAYIHIQTERFGDNLQLHWNISEHDKQHMLVPMSLQLLLENAIKHNVISKAKPLVINVYVKENQLVVENKIAPKSTQLPSTKVGLKNIEKRYSLISGQSIKIQKDKTYFRVLLPLLNSTNQETL